MVDDSIVCNFILSIAQSLLFTDLTGVNRYFPGIFVLYIPYKYSKRKH